MKTDQEAIEYFRQERDRLERDPLWRAAWLAARDQGQELFTFDGVEWWV